MRREKLGKMSRYQPPVSEVELVSFPHPLMAHVVTCARLLCTACAQEETAGSSAGAAGGDKDKDGSAADATAKADKDSAGSGRDKDKDRSGKGGKRSPRASLGESCGACAAH